MLSSLLQPPPTLISETINRYRQNEMFKGAFYLTEEDQYKPHDQVQDLLNEEDEEEEVPALQEPAFDQEGTPSFDQEGTPSFDLEGTLQKKSPPNLIIKAKKRPSCIAESPCRPRKIKMQPNSSGIAL